MASHQRVVFPHTNLILHRKYLLYICHHYATNLTSQELDSRQMTEKRANGKKEQNEGKKQHRKLNRPNSLRGDEAESRQAQSGNTYITDALLQKGLGMSVTGPREGRSIST